MLIGRKEEQNILLNALNDSSSHLIAVYGRRRVGKTYLVRESFQDKFCFQHSGVYNGNRKTQLKAFYGALLDAGLPESEPVPKDWLEAFQMLKTVIAGSDMKRKVVFIDELSWMDTPRSDMMMALEHFWNSWASARKDIVMILCSSATSWIINKVIHNKGGLYNRLTGRIHLQPFTLHNCREYSEAKHLSLSDTQIMELYMIIGGVPFYWDQLRKGYSVPQNVDALFFERNAPLKDEYNYLFASIFRNPENYIELIKALAGRKGGLTRNELLKKTGLTGSGTVTRQLKELESCGFIREYNCFGKKTKDKIYQLIDPFVLFYHHFMIKAPDDPQFWLHQVNTPSVNSWGGLAFERVCLIHIEQIREALGIRGVLTNVYSFTCHADPELGIEGTQIDLLIQRADRITNILEMKYSHSEYTINKTLSRELRRKVRDFRIATGTNDGIHVTLVTPYGLKWNEYAGEIQSQITGEDLFHK